MIEDRPYVDVLVNLPYLSSEEIYTYFLPQGCEGGDVGHLVAVSFGSHETDGLIVRRHSQRPDHGSLKPISLVLSEMRIFSDQQIALAQELARRFVTSTWSFLSASSPPYSKLGVTKFAKLEKDYVRGDEAHVDSAEKLPDAINRRLRSNQQLRDVLILPTLQSSYPIMAKIAISRSRVGKVVVALPDIKDLGALSAALSEVDASFSVLSSHQSKSERFAQYLSANSSESGIFLTLRSGVFLHLEPRDTLIVVNDVERHHYEMHSPTWNTRDVALTRSSNSSIIFISRSPSVEMVRQIELGWFTKYIFPQSSIKRMKFSANEGENNASHRIISEGLKRGHVLISVGRAGYINGIVCRKCRNVAECECGGRLVISQAEKTPHCALCLKDFLSWSCAWCRSEEMYAISRGAERTAAEFGRVFPGSTVISSSADQQIRELGTTPTLVVATPGSEPIAHYSAIVVLDAERAYGQIELRSQEEVRSHWFNLLTLLEKDGEIFFAMPSSLEVSQGLMRSNAYDLALREMHERNRVNLPPFTRLLSLGGSFSEVKVLNDLLDEKGISSYGLQSGKDGKGRLLVKIPVERNEEILQLFAALTRIKVAKKEEAFSYRFDPYAID
jgi:primosomal protein N' (replication factor Y)